MKSFFVFLLDLVLRYVLAIALLLAALGLVWGLQAAGASENVAGVVAAVFLVTGAVAIVVYSRRNAARSDGASRTRQSAGTT
ncbi:MAG: hypothetical protein Q7T55_23995 [Solirubrobacteraceae bacterium]|nr:hypothetical protein [Solirubrobacteraceae bacterium]